MYFIHFPLPVPSQTINMLHLRQKKNEMIIPFCKASWNRKIESENVSRISNIRVHIHIEARTLNISESPELTRVVFFSCMDWCFGTYALMLL